MKKKSFIVCLALTFVLGCSMVSVNAEFTNGSTTNSSYSRSSAKSYIESYTTTPNTLSAVCGLSG